MGKHLGRIALLLACIAAPLVWMLVRPRAAPVALTSRCSVVQLVGVVSRAQRCGADLDGDDDGRGHPSPRAELMYRLAEALKRAVARADTDAAVRVYDEIQISPGKHVVDRGPDELID